MFLILLGSKIVFLIVQVVNIIQFCTLFKDAIWKKPKECSSLKYVGQERSLNARSIFVWAFQVNPYPTVFFETEMCDHYRCIRDFGICGWGLQYKKVTFFKSIFYFFKIYKNNSYFISMLNWLRNLGNTSCFMVCLPIFCKRLYMVFVYTNYMKWN